MITLFVSNSNPQITSSNGSQVTLSLNPPIMLDPNKKYYASAVEVDIVYCFANIFTGVNDKFKYSEGGVNYTHTFSQGIYSISALQEEINRCTQSDVQNDYLFVLEPDTSTSHIYIHFMSKTSTIDCRGSDNLMKILGYPEDSNTTGILGPVININDFYEGDNCKLNNIQNVLILASFVNGAYQNSQARNVLASVTPDVAPYSTILYRPQYPVFVPVTQNILDQISFQIVDQDNNSINMGKHTGDDTYERWSARIIIKELDKI